MSLRYIIMSAVIAFSGDLVLAKSTSQQFKTDTEIKQILINESISSYPGNCPCPYNGDRRGRRCGGRSAYSKPGGYSPLCYDSDITPSMIENYRRLHKN